MVGAVCGAGIGSVRGNETGGEAAADHVRACGSGAGERETERGRRGSRERPLGKAIERIYEPDHPPPGCCSILELKFL